MSTDTQNDIFGAAERTAAEHQAENGKPPARRDYDEHELRSAVARAAGYYWSNPGTKPHVACERICEQDFESPPARTIITAWKRHGEEWGVIPCPIVSEDYDGFRAVLRQRDELAVEVSRLREENVRCRAIALEARIVGKTPAEIATILATAGVEADQL